MQSKRQCRRIFWIHNWALQIHCNPMVLLDANKLVLKGWMKNSHRGLQKIYVLWYSFYVLSESFARTFQYKQLFFPWIMVFLRRKSFVFDLKRWKLIEFEERFLRDLSPFYVIGVLSFQLVSILEKPESKFKSFFIEESKILSLHFNTVYARTYS